MGWNGRKNKKITDNESFTNDEVWLTNILLAQKNYVIRECKHTFETHYSKRNPEWASTE